VEYKLEGYNLFMEMMAQIRRNVIYNVYMFKPAEAEAKQKAYAAAQEQAAKQNGSRGKKAKTPAPAA
jgi:preprotein translocase subunit SecA